MPRVESLPRRDAPWFSVEQPQPASFSTARNETRDARGNVTPARGSDLDGHVTGHGMSLNRRGTAIVPRGTFRVFH